MTVNDCFPRLCAGDVEGGLTVDVLSQLPAPPREDGSGASSNVREGGAGTNPITETIPQPPNRERYLTLANMVHLPQILREFQQCPHDSNTKWAEQSQTFASKAAKDGRSVIKAYCL